MLFAWAVTAFAAGLIVGKIAGRNTFEVRVFVKSLPNSRVAGAANQMPDVAAGGWFWGVRSAGR